jgi:uncharacterized protein (TIGR03437 family)
VYYKSSRVRPANQFIGKQNLWSVIIELPRQIMDAAYNSVKKTVLFVVATALLLAAPFRANAQSIVINPAFAGNTIQISNSSCNDTQALNLTSTGTSIPITVSITYGSSDQNGDWLFARTGAAGPTYGGTTATFNDVIPTIGSPAGPAGINLTIGLNRTISSITDQAFVTLTDTANAANSVTITVNYVYNSSCGGNTGSQNNGYIQVTPGTLTMTAGQGGSQTLQLGVQNNTAATIYFSASTPPGDTWLSTGSALSTPVAGGSTATVNVTANATGLNVNTYSSQGVTITASQGIALTIPVTFAVTAGSGTGGSGTLTLDGGKVTSRIFQYVSTGSVPGASCIAIADSNTSITSYSDSFGTSSGGSWLTVNNSSISPQTNQSFGGNCLYVQPNNTVISLGSGVYTATITVSDSGGSTATANITLDVTAGAASGVSVSPGVIYNFSGVTTGSTATESQAFSVTALSPITLGTATVQNSTGWLTMTAGPTGAGTGTETFTLTANPTGLAAGTYSATILVPDSNAQNTTILVSLAVGQSTSTGGGGTVTSTVVPTSLSFASELNNTAWSGGGEEQAITITGASGTQWSSGVSYGSSGGNWLRFGGASGSTGGTFGSSSAFLLVDIQPSGLAASPTPYTATITVTTPSGITQVAVTLLVTSTGNHVLLASPALTTFTYSSGTSSGPQQVVFSDTNSGFPGSPGATPAIAVTTATTWLTATSTGNTMTLNASATGLATGAYAGTVTVTAAGYPNSPLTYPVVFVVNGGTSTGPLTLSTSGMTFNAVASGSLPATQTLTVTAASAISVTAAVAEQSCSNYTWLTIAPSGGFTATASPSSFSVSVNQSGIAAGSTCTGTLSFETASATQTVSVSMIVSASGTGGTITVSPSALQQFSYTLGGSNPAAQTLTIANATSGTSPVFFTVTSSASWLTTSAGTSTVSTPYSLIVTANPSGLAASATPYAASLTITPSGGTPTVVNATFAISGLPVVSATPTTLAFTYSVGGSNPSNQTVAVTGGGAAATFSVSTSSSGWLTVSPNCTATTPCTTPNTGTYNLTVTANPTGLNVQTYNGSITIAGTGQATGSTIVNVSFVISAPLPTITKVTNGASFATGAISPGELISLFANASNPIGPTPAVQLSGTTCPSPCTVVPTTMGGVQVEFLPQGVLAPLLYVSATQINAVVPYEVQTAGGSVSVEVKYLGQASNAFNLQTATTAPGIISLLGSGTGTAAMNQYDTSGNYQGINSASNPASSGWVLVMYVTGEGSIPSAVDGAVTASTTVKPLAGAPTVLIDQLPATVQYYGEAYGIVSGVMQMNVLIPAGIHTSQADTLSFTIGGNISQAGITVQIK